MRVATREEDEMLDCPVCAKLIDRNTAPTSVHEGVTYYFRCARCKERFIADPGRYLRGGADPDHGGCGEHGQQGHTGHVSGPRP